MGQSATSGTNVLFTNLEFGTTEEGVVFCGLFLRTIFYKFFLYSHKYFLCSKLTSKQFSILTQESMLIYRFLSDSYNQLCFRYMNFHHITFFPHEFGYGEKLGYADWRIHHDDGEWRYFDILIKEINADDVSFILDYFILF